MRFAFLAVLRSPSGAETVDGRCLAESLEEARTILKTGRDRYVCSEASYRCGMARMPTVAPRCHACWQPMGDQSGLYHTRCHGEKKREWGRAAQAKYRAAGKEKPRAKRDLTPLPPALVAECRATLASQMEATVGKSGRKRGPRIEVSGRGE